MAESNNLGLPFLEAGQAQKHVTLNESLRILDAAIHMSVAAITSATPGSPEEGERHIVGVSPSGAFAGHVNAVATYEDGAWRFLPPRTGWRAWVEAEDILYVFDGAEWRDLRDLAVSLDEVVRLGVNTSSEGENLLAVRSNAALLHAIEDTDGGNGDIRLQLSKEASGDTASVFFSTDFEGRAEFGLVEGEDFKLKVSADGEDWIESLVVDPASGTVAFPLGAELRGKTALSGEISPSAIASSQNNYDPAGLANAAVLRLSSDASRNLTGLAGGEGGRLVVIQNTGNNNIVLIAEGASSSAANRFAFAADITLSAKQCAMLQYDTTANRWRALASPSAATGGGSIDQELLDAQLSLALADALNAAQFFGESGNRVADSFDATTYLDTAGSTNLNTAVAGLIKPTSSTSNEDSATGTNTATAGWTYINRSLAVDNSTSVSAIRIYATSAYTGTARVLLQNSSTSYTSAASVAFSHTGSGWEVFTLASPFAVPGSGTYYLSVYGTSTPQGFAGSQPRSFVNADIAGTNSSVTEDGSPGAAPSIGVAYAGSTNNMTALSSAFTAASEPSGVRAVLRAKFISAVTINTDLTIEVSRDGGANWSAGTLIDKFTTPGTAHRVLDTGDISVSGQPSGSSIRWRIKSLNNKSLEIHDAYLRWS